MDNGFEIIDDFINKKTLNSIYAEVNKFPISDNKGGFRNAEKLLKPVNDIAQSKFILNFASQYLPASAKLMRAIVFCKTEQNNWLVPWHQDKTVAVSSKFKINNWHRWSIKDNIHHVQPPAAVMKEMITIRIHLNNTNRENGCLKIIPKSHQLEILSQDAIRAITQSQQATYCEANTGAALVMRPLLLHSSERMENQCERSVLHLEYSSYQLPKAISWG